MWADKLLDLIFERRYSSGWADRFTAAYNDLFGSPGGRYAAKAKGREVKPRAPDVPESDEKFVPFGALIHPSNPDSGAYGGTSLVIFPGEEAPCLISLVVGTNGLAPDEQILGRPGHARKTAAICSWLNAEERKFIAWSKYDPTRLDQRVPEPVTKAFDRYGRVFDRYGHVVYAMYAPGPDRNLALRALTAFLDLLFEERGVRPLTDFQPDADSIRSRWYRHLMTQPSESDLIELLNERRYVILQGPPGTGKTYAAGELISKEYKGRGSSIQFHANTTYEDFVGGLAPRTTAQNLGFQFAPKKGFLINAIEEAQKSPEKYLLHIDEINRADLSKVLGEAIYLLETDDPHPRVIGLPYTFDAPTGARLSLPSNLHILGTMNSSDRSLAIVDIAIRRRFAFAKLWPQLSVLDQQSSCDLMKEAFERLLSIFVEYATEDALDLVPGHSYFLEKDDRKARTRLKTTLKPLLEDYIVQGYVSAFAEALRSYLQWVNSL